MYQGVCVLGVGAQGDSVQGVSEQVVHMSFG